MTSAATSHSPPWTLSTLTSLLIWFTIVIYIYYTRTQNTQLSVFTSTHNYLYSSMKDTISEDLEKHICLSLESLKVRNQCTRPLRDNVTWYKTKFRDRSSACMDHFQIHAVLFVWLLSGCCEPTGSAELRAAASSCSHSAHCCCWW